MTKFQIVSDLHIEYKDNVPDPLSLITPSADILILAGDIGSFYKYDQLKIFLTKLCKYFEIVLYVPGNHEYYLQKGFTQKKMKVLFKLVKHIEHSIDNLYILNKTSVQINDICIVGCTLWSNPRTKIPRYIVRIDEMNTKFYKNKFKEELEYITMMIEYCKKKQTKLLVITHHMPTYAIFDNKTINNKYDKYISLYASDLDYLLNKDSVHTWVAGHIHINFDIITEGGTHLVGNQLGKLKDNIKDYNMEKIITL